jgi:hypothetical protein
VRAGLFWSPGFFGARAARVPTLEIVGEKKGLFFYELKEVPMTKELICLYRRVLLQEIKKIFT